MPAFRRPVEPRRELARRLGFARQSPHRDGWRRRRGGMAGGRGRRARRRCRRSRNSPSSGSTRSRPFSKSTASASRRSRPSTRPPTDSDGIGGRLGPVGSDAEIAVAELPPQAVYSGEYERLRRERRRIAALSSCAPGKVRAWRCSMPRSSASRSACRRSMYRARRATACSRPRRSSARPGSSPKAAGRPPPPATSSSRSLPPAAAAPPRRSSS